MPTYKVNYIIVKMAVLGLLQVTSTHSQIPSWPLPDLVPS